MPSERPNILFFLSDQHNARCMSCAGEPVLSTPTMDRLAQHGVRFSSAYSNSAHCGPSRVSFLTGIYEHYHQRHNNTDEPPDHLNPITAELKNAGYQTALIGKGHLGVRWPRKEFDYHRFSTMTDAGPEDTLGSDYFRGLVEAGLADNFDMSGKHKRHPDCAHTSPLPLEHSVEVWAGNETIRYLRQRDKDKPFFAMVSFERPHDPLSVPVPYDQLYDLEEVRIPPNAVDTFEGKSKRQQRAKRGELVYPYRPRDEAHLRKCIAYYYALVTLIDAQMGRVLDELREQGVLENTIVIYSADHGDFAGEHGLIWKNLGFYESIHHIPMIISYPAALPTGLLFEEFVESVDVYPTLMALLGLPTPCTVQGRSLLGALTEGKPWGKRAALCEHVKEYHHMSMRTRDFRITVDLTGDESELYDHRTDPGELVNRWSDPAFRDIREKLLLDLIKYRSCPPLLFDWQPPGWKPGNVPGYEHPSWPKALMDAEEGVPWSEIVARDKH
jgi:arylsulfatase A-like enzyme